MLNDRVDPPIDVVAVPTTELLRFSKNRYVDPEDGVAFDEQDLTPLDKGHVYRYRKVGPWVSVHSPYRVVDQESGPILLRLPSFQTVVPAISKNLRYRNKVQNCLRHFQLSGSDFETFMEYGLERGWVFEKDEVPLEELKRDVASLREVLEELPVLLGQLLTEVRRDGGPQNQADLDAFLRGLQSMRRLLREGIPDARLKVAKQLDLLSLEPERHVELALLNAEMLAIAHLFHEATQLDLDRHEREGIHLYRARAGLEELGQHLRPLSLELQELQRVHPSLRFLSVEGSDLLFRMDGLEIRVTPTALMVKGDPSVLRPFLGSSPLDEGETSTSDRFKMIVPRKKSSGV